MSEYKNIGKTLKEQEYELKDELCSTRIMMSKINIQFEEIQRLMGKVNLKKFIIFKF